MAIGDHLAVTEVVWHNGGMWSLALAVLSLLCGWLFTAIPAVICGPGAPQFFNAISRTRIDP
jgi:hypothetical protein